METIEILNKTNNKKDFNQLDHFQNQVIQSINTFTEKEPEINFTWHDEQSNAKGYLVINSLKGNACGGGTRIHENITIEEVKTLAKIMEIKFRFSKPEIGGAKTGIKLDPNHPQKYDILKRWFEAIKPILKSCYGTGSDLNTDIKKINEILKTLDIDNSQEGIIHAITAGNLDKKSKALDNMNILSKSLTLSDKLSMELADLVTGYGVVTSINSFYNITGDHLKDKKVYLQGVGNVGAATLWYLFKSGAQIVALSDQKGGLIIEKGINEEQVTKIIENKALSPLGIELYDHDEFHKQFNNLSVDVFIPAAGSNLVTREFIDELYNYGLSLIACGANHPFIEKEYCYGQCSQYLDKKLTVIPDFLANMGMARAFYYLMQHQDQAPPDSESVFNDINKEIDSAIKQAYQMNNGKLMTASLYQIALDRIL